MIIELILLTRGIKEGQFDDCGTIYINKEDVSFIHSEFFRSATDNETKVIDDVTIMMVKSGPTLYIKGNVHDIKEKVFSI